MKIGIKYCGGCNPLFDRSLQIDVLKKEFPEHEYCYLNDGNKCDIWIVVCGCLRACAYIDDLIGNKIFVADTVDKFNEIKKYLENMK